MNLSPHFTLAEFVRSPTAARRGIDNAPSPAIVAALTGLCVHVLEPLREDFAERPVSITSGYRSPALNRAIGGSATSRHCFGEAADFTIPGVRNLDVAQWIQRTLPFDQLIYEFGEAGWIHVSWRPANRRHQELTARRVGGRVKYLPGLVRDGI